MNKKCDRSELANHRPAFQSHDNNIMKKKAVAGKPQQKPRNKQNFACIFEAFRNIENGFNLHHWTALNVIKTMPCCLKGLMQY